MEGRELSIIENKQFNASAWKGWKKPFVEEVCSFHTSLEEYEKTPLVELDSLAAKLGLDGVWVKDESLRFGLKAYKALGGSYAIARFLQQRYDLKNLNFDNLHARNFPDSDKCIFATMTDGNHGLGVAYIASKLGYSAQIYVPKEMVPARIEAIKKVGGTVTVFEGGYDDAARQIAKDASKNGWQVISDTAWENYTQIPEWIIEGYSTMFEEIREQLGELIPTHIFIQAGVGSLASSLVQYFRTMYGEHSIKIVITEPDHANCFYHSAVINDGKAHQYPGEVDTMMAGLACAEPNPIAWPYVRDGANYMLSCSDKISALGMRTYFNPTGNDQQIISGEAGAVTLGAIQAICSNPEYSSIHSKLGLNKGAKILLVNTEGDTDPVNFKKIIN